MKRLALALLCLIAGGGVARAAAGFAGWQTTGSTYTSVAATIRVPWVTNQTISADNNVIAWVGIEDGTRLAQVGITLTINAQGTPSFGEFYEMFPAGAVPDPNMGHTTTGGDIVQLSITCTANCSPGSTQTWGMTVKNVTKGWTWAPSDTLLTNLSKFDVMMEDLNTSNPMPNFGTLTFTNISVNGAAPNWASTSAFQVTDGYGGTANPSSVSGTAFSVCAGRSSTYTTCPQHLSTSLANGRISLGRF
ncbi:MAG: G1 family glutamic endopeptidase [Stellaceae bacterium]